MKPPKTYQDIMNDMVGDVLKTTSAEALATGSAMKSLLEAMEMDMYSGWPKHEIGVRKLLGKLKVKSALEGRAFVSGSLQIESLDAVLKQVTFDDTGLKRWKTDGGK